MDGVELICPHSAWRNDQGGVVSGRLEDPLVLLGKVDGGDQLHLGDRRGHDDQVELE